MSEKWDEGRNPWRVKRTRTIHADPWLTIEGNDVVRPDGAEGDYTIVRVRKTGVGIIAIEDDGGVHMVGQWRLPLGRYSWELPEGGVEPNEDVLDGARRELSEEAGLTAKTWVKILELDLSTSLTDERATIFLAAGLAHGQSHPEDVEVLRRRCAPFGELLERIADGQIREAMTVAGLLRVHAMAVNGELPADISAAVLK